MIVSISSKFSGEKSYTFGINLAARLHGIALHAGNSSLGLAKVLGVLTHDNKVISTWRDCEINAFQHGTIKRLLV